jgi:hypothetical protein
MTILLEGSISLSSLSPSCKVVTTFFITQYMRNQTIVCLLKMEHAPKINLFNLKMMVKSGLEKNILKFIHAQNYSSISLSAAPPAK